MAFIRKVLKTSLSTLSCLSVAGLAMIIGVMALQVAFMRSHPWSRWVDFLVDDAYYYLGVAWNIGHNHISQFRAPLLTNGCQPLWLALLSAFEFVTNGDKALLAQGAILLTGFFIILAFVIAVRTKVVHPFAVVITVLCFVGVFLVGQETVLTLPIVLLLILSRQKNSRFSTLLFAALFYARLDGLAAFPVFQAYDYFFKKKPLSAIIKETGYLVLLIVPYFVYNYLRFGVPVPISGMAKSLGSVPGENLSALVWYLYTAKLPVLIVLATWILRRISRIKSTNESQTVAILFLIVHGTCMVYYTMFSGWPMWGWYCWPSAIATVFAASAFLDAVCDFASSQTISVPKQAVAVLFFAVVLFLLARPASLYFKGSLHDFTTARKSEKAPLTFAGRNVTTIFELLDKRSGTEVVAMGDRAGSLGYWMPERHQFVHTEGLVASKEYYDAMKNGTAPEFLKKTGVTLLIVEKEQYLVSNTNGTTQIGVIEPSQLLSARRGPYVMCFPTEAIVYSETYKAQIRYVFQFDKMVPCSEDIKTKFDSLRNTYGGIRNFSLLDEYNNYRPALQRRLGLPW